ncbi:hypothetical protein NPIL_189691 [Nephila pilipes]|uniref:Uncharacterized protein n=1 Tax=Nephila pilipes TaxID=299642 RepID=A0A8X6PS46_NEPPI|nr:hypothetical protein NPIL_189691 [Nephila pilipes]
MGECRGCTRGAKISDSPKKLNGGEQSMGWRHGCYRSQPPSFIERDVLSDHSRPCIRFHAALAHLSASGWWIKRMGSRGTLDVCCVLIGGTVLRHCFYLLVADR